MEPLFVTEQTCQKSCHKKTTKISFLWFACYCVEVIQKNPKEVREHLNSATLDQSNVTKTAKYKKTLPLIFTHFLPLSMRLFQQIFLEFSPIFVSFSFSLK